MKEIVTTIPLLPFMPMHAQEFALYVRGQMNSLPPKYLIRQIPVLLLALAAGGCSSLPLAADYAGPKQIPPVLQEDFSYDKYPGPYSETVLKQEHSYTLIRITFPSKHNLLPGQHDIKIDYYAIDSPNKVPVVLVFPILGGSNSIASSFARYFAEHGLAAAIIHRQKDYKKPEYIKQINTILCQIIFDHKQAIDWIESRPELDATRIGVFGVSMG